MSAASASVPRPTKPDIEVKVIYIKDMEDAALSKEAALSLISGGADFVYGKLNAAQMGLIQAAKEKGVYTSGRSFGHVAAAPETVVTATIENWPSDVRGGRESRSRTARSSRN